MFLRENGGFGEQRRIATRNLETVAITALSLKSRPKTKPRQPEG
jgi:hypothetical protein